MSSSPSSSPSSCLVMLVRHGESEANVCARERRSSGVRKRCASGPDTPLTPLGEQQARVTARAILLNARDFNVRQNIFISSPYARAAATAEPLVSLLREQGVEMRLTLDPLLREYAGTDGPSGESARELEQRVRAVASMLDFECARAPPKSMLVVFGHSVVFSLLLSYLGSGSQHVPTNVVFSVGNCSLSLLECKMTKRRESPTPSTPLADIALLGIASSWRIHTVASQAHLGDVEAT